MSGAQDHPAAETTTPSKSRVPKPQTHCAYCGKYVRPESPQRAADLGTDSDGLLCRSCDESLNPEES